MTQQHTISASSSAVPAEMPAFSLVRPENDCALMFSSPHSGRHYPDNFLKLLRVPLMDLRRVEDAFVDQLIRGVTLSGAGQISANYSRSYVDLNRAPNELDSRMFRDGPPNPPGERSPRVEAGLGCIPRVAWSGHDIHRRKLRRSEADERLELAYHPYHAALADLLEDIAARHGHATLIDCHSMPSVIAGRRVQADIIIGNRHGGSCDESLTRTIEDTLTRFGYRVLRNQPYAGGYLTQLHGRPMADRHALQIEINRRLYMDENEVTLKPGFERLREDLSELADQIVRWSKKKPRL